MRKPDRQWIAASEVAKARGIPKVSCSVCYGRGIARHPAPEEETGIDEIDPCPGCDGYGITFGSAPSMELSATELLARFRAAS